MKTYSEKQLRTALGILSGRVTEQNLPEQQKIDFLAGGWMVNRTWAGMLARAEDIVADLIMHRATVAAGVGMRTNYAVGEPDPDTALREAAEAWQKADEAAADAWLLDIIDESVGMGKTQVLELSAGSSEVLAATHRQWQEAMRRRVNMTCGQAPWNRDAISDKTEQ